jgi:EAL domain-containing protein (putative c-di-GMP-specific phosphodiesterase class I)/GGDEF domain-containing protein
MSGAIQAGRRARRHSIALRGVCFGLCLLATIAGACIATAFLVQHNLALRQSKETALDVAHLVSRHTAQRLATAPADVGVTAERLSDFRHVERVVILDAAGEVRALSGALQPSDLKLARRALQTRSEIAAVRANATVVAIPEIFDGRPVGALLIAMSRESVANALFAAMIVPFLIVLSVLSVLVAVPVVFYVRWETRPLRALTAFAEDVSVAKLSRRVKVSTGDDYEVLADAFNHMMDRLERAMKRIQQLAFVEPVTQLPNHERFHKALNDSIAQNAANGAEAAAFLLTFEGGRRLMETLDQDARRDLMGAVARRLTHAVRTVDKVVRIQSSQSQPMLVACLRNDDFALLAPSVANASEAARLAQMVCTAMNQPFQWRDQKLMLGALCGVALAPRDGRDADTVIRHAALARRAARRDGGELKFFTRALDRDAVRRIAFEREMRAGLERNEFRAYFQPKVDLITGRIESAEALARWIKPDGAIVPPSRFVAAAEDNGLIAELSEAILLEAAWKAAGWAREGLPVQVAVNVSAVQFRNESFPDRILRMLDLAGLPPYFLELELTETIAMEDPDRTARLIEPLRARGVRFAIDDFGCGHSSLAVLARLPFDVIKIDRQFVHALSQPGTQGPALIEAMLAMARTLDIAVVAEGVERQEEAQFLRTRGCRYAQGFLYGAAVAPQQFAALLKRQRETAPEPLAAGADAA